MRFSILLATILSAFALAPAAIAQQRDAVAASQPGAAGVAQTVNFDATITAIDKAARAITLKGPKGNEVKVVAGPEVKNFDQLKVGDTVQAQYAESLVLELKKGGGKPVAKTEKSGMASAKPGEKPAAIGARQVTVVGDVTKVDAATQTVTVKGPNRTVDLNVKDREQFKLIKVGDQIEATYTEALALAVNPTAKPAAKPAAKAEAKK
jgi:Cu/Ag efflux protein CusF